MSVFLQTTSEDLAKRTHTGWLLACPVDVWQFHTGGTVVSEKNWIPEFWFALNMKVWHALVYIASAVDPEYVPKFPLVLKEI